MNNILTNPQLYAELPLEGGYSLIRQVIQDDFFCQDEILLHLDFKCPYNKQKSFKLKIESINFENNVEPHNHHDSTLLYINSYTYRNGKIYKRVDEALLIFDTEEYLLAEKITKSFIRERFCGQTIMDFLESF